METRKTVRKLAYIAGAAALALAVAVGAPQAAHAETTEEPATVPQFKRLAGGTALGTAAKIAYEGWSSSEYAVLCRNDGWHDALAASGVAGLLDAPILLVKTGELPSATEKALKKLGVKKAIVAGGTAAVSDTVVSQVGKLGISVERVAGGNASGTARALYSWGRKHGGWSSTCAVATLNTYQDALSIASYSWARRCPVFLATERQSDGSRSLSSKVAQTIKSGGFTRTLVLGGTSAVSSSVDGQAPGAKRLKGGNAYSTSAAIGNFCVSEGMTVRHTGLATGSGYHDALAGAALCGKKNSVLLLVDNKVSGVGAVAVERVLAPRKGEMGQKADYTDVENDSWTMTTPATSDTSYIFGGFKALETITYPYQYGPTCFLRSLGCFIEDEAGTLGETKEYSCNHCFKWNGNCNYKYYMDNYNWYKTYKTHMETQHSDYEDLQSAQIASKTVTKNLYINTYYKFSENSTISPFITHG